MPAGTGNLLATNLGIPVDLHQALEIGLHGNRRPLDTGSVNGEHFAVMAGGGFDAFTMRGADSGLKGRIGSIAYIWSGALNLDAPVVQATVVVDGERFFRGELSCVLLANVGKVLGGIEAFDGDARKSVKRLRVAVHPASITVCVGQEPKGS